MDLDKGKEKLRKMIWNMKGIFRNKKPMEKEN